MNCKLIVVALATIGSLVTLNNSARAQGTAFTYQGRLSSGGAPVDGNYDFRLSLFAGNTGGAAIAGPVTNSAVSVTNGLFTFTLDFGNQFPGAARWLELAVRTNLNGAFTTLSPRQPLTATPYAVTASNVTGIVTSANIAGAYGGAVTFNNPANSFSGVFSGNGANVTNVNAAMLGGLAASDYWQLSGNNVGAGQYLGTANNQALELKANGTRGLRIEPNTNGAPNIIGGSPLNYVAPGVVGGFIGGGGATNYNTGTLLVGYTQSNSIQADFGAISGGDVNSVQLGATYSAIGGGFGNQIQPAAAGSFIGGGNQNIIQSNQVSVVLAGGDQNSIDSQSSFSVIGGGGVNIIHSSSPSSVISGGEGNTVFGGSDHATIGGGQGNAIDTGTGSATISGGSGNYVLTGDYSVIAGGNGNEVAANAANTRGSVIGGGENNTNSGNVSVIGGGNLNVIVPQGVFIASETIGGGSFNTIGYTTRFGAIDSSVNGQRTIAGGAGNFILAGAGDSTIGGGSDNTVLRNGQFATIPGGRENQAADYAFAAGYRAAATNSGSFVWADGSSSSGFNSTANNQFLIRAVGNVGINTNHPAATLDINGTLRVGAGTTIFKNLQGGIAQMASGSSTVKTNFTFTFPKAFSTVPNVVISPVSGNIVPVDDTFAVTVRLVTTTSCTVNVVRVDNPSGWSQQLKINWLAWE